MACSGFAGYDRENDDDSQANAILGEVASPAVLLRVVVVIPRFGNRERESEYNATPQD